MFRDLSFRIKIPLRGLILMGITASVVSAALIFRAYADLRKDIHQNAESLAGVLADSLIPEIGHDNVWRAFGLITAALREPNAELGSQPSFIVVLDTNFRVFVSSHPQKHPMLADLPAREPDFALVIARLRETGANATRLVEPPGSAFFYLAQPIVSDENALGSLILAYPHDMFQPRLRRIVLDALLITLIVVAVMLPFNWYWGSHLADPLVDLAAHMRNASNLPDPAQIRETDSGDEVGQLTAAFKRMLTELREKQYLEQQIVASDRLAALGRLSAGIAHEINNPLGGMLNAVSTLHRHTDLDALATKSLGLIERGLNQIRDTVGALLVEARMTRQALTGEDIEDVRTLALAQKYEHSAALIWRNEVTGAIDLPSTQVRQILLNLLLNAFQATPAGGRVWARVGIQDARLCIEVANEGAAISEDHLPFLFEPFATLRTGGSGLGLWVSYQIVKQLNGMIDATSEEGVTRFRVQLPIGNSAS